MGQGGQRILALYFPYLAPERILRQRLGRHWRALPAAPGEAGAPLVISHRDRNAQRICALDERAEALGLKRGMGLADARAMHPDIDIVEADPHADRRLLESLADWCDRYTPLVAIDGADGLFLDITGCAHLFGGEKALLDDLMARFFHQGFDVRAALASTPGAAWAAARFRSGAVIGRGAEAELMQPLPLPALRLEAATRAGLESVGLRTAGAVMAAPRAPLVRRFGRQLMLRLDQALGRVEEAVSPRMPVAALSVERLLAEPISLMADIEALVLILAGRLKSEMLRRGEGARQIELRLFRVDGAVSRVAIGTSRPLREPRLILRLFHERLAALESEIDAGYGFDLVRLSVLAAAGVDDEQTSLTGDTGDAGEDVALFADRVRARLGRNAILQPVLAQSHLPEEACGLFPYGEAPAAAIHSLGKPRPLRLLLRPEPVDVTAEVPEGPPLNFRWRRALYQVSRSEGPERIAPEWWRLSGPVADAGEPGEEEDPEEASERAEEEAMARLTRDYFRIEDMAGHRYWLFREGFYGRQRPPRWFMHGVFA